MQGPAQHSCEGRDRKGQVTKSGIRVSFPRGTRDLSKDPLWDAALTSRELNQPPLPSASTSAPLQGPGQPWSGYSIGVSDLILGNPWEWLLEILGLGAGAKQGCEVGFLFLCCSVCAQLLSPPAPRNLGSWWSQHWPLATNSSSSERGPQNLSALRMPQLIPGKIKFN